MEKEQLISELSFKAVRSSGSGGQNVNKVATKVELYFDLENSQSFTEEEKTKLKKSLSKKLNKDCILILQSSKTRSQFKNKQLVIVKFLDLIEEGLKEQKKRIPTKTPKSVKRKRLKAKKQKAEIKANRKKPDVE
ncbi:aminoacyl-tRNA hydrolase [Flavobacteriaceae bacterium S0825]|uniref:alternative ribosome rescue aminoacyl-tRNA hydrolase ArfB n=1 Tax=Gaetbulibacter sp. S0825 TaxID=2720084 RepID=UPI00142FC6A6|nr:alternative ribosome rescue aminoacyl-tRNA hydrolase ArfB [Gaetbulibacter sp. S0825]MCK0107982.1 aminoacyl-tRNA hydrolase [Flavobacteriaceae bacterium S0825]NIX63618.1 aminoacyl-tRNA hydrolase [Gaetbulibacter sp. S0825]